MTFRFFIISVGLLFAAVPAAAQDILADAPEELQDFRLDAPPPKPQPTVQLPPPIGNESATTTPKTSAPNTSTPDISASSPEPRRNAPSSNAIPSADAPTSSNSVRDPNGTNDPANSDSDDAATPTKTNTEIEINEKLNTAPPVTIPTAPIGWPEWLPLTLLPIGILILFAAIILFKRRQSAGGLSAKEMATGKQATSAPEALEQNDHIAPVEDADMPEQAAIKPAPAPSKPSTETKMEPAKDVPKIPLPQPELEMRFVPQSAALGPMNLTLRGELKIVNIGKAMARNVLLNSGATSACDNQQQLIDEFFNTAGPADYQTIENIRKGERISIAIETIIPRAELSSYTHQGREICVPIMVAEMRYSGLHKSSGQSVRLSAMIGREANPPMEKLGPLRLDLGPRSFTALGHRMIGV